LIIPKDKKKFFIANKTIVFSIIIIIAGVVGYVLCLFAEYQQTVLAAQGELQHLIKWVSILKNVILVFISIFGTAILSMVLIEVSSKNNLYEDIILADILESDEFYNNLNHLKKERILRKLEDNMFFQGNPVLSEMYAEVKTKLPVVKQEKYYYESYDSSIICKLEGNKIIKTITKTICLKSFEGTEHITDYVLANHVCRSVEKNCTIVGLTAYLNRNQEQEPTKEATTVPIDAMEKKCGYNLKSTISLVRPLVLRHDETTTLTVHYTTSVSIKDKSFIFRAPVACKTSRFQFELDSNDDARKRFRVISCGFGFADSASKTHNDPSSDHSVNLTFENWTFPQDGVVIILEEKI